MISSDRLPTSFLFFGFRQLFLVPVALGGDGVDLDFDRRRSPLSTSPTPTTGLLIPRILPCVLFGRAAGGVAEVF